MRRRHNPRRRLRPRRRTPDRRPPPHEDPPTTDRFDDLDRHQGAPPPLDPAPVYDIDGDDDGTTTPLDPPPPPELDGNDLETIDHEYPAGQVDDIIEGTDNSSEGAVRRPLGQLRRRR